MNKNGRPGFFRRTWTGLGAALRQGLLGKSSHEYMKQFTGSDEYFAEAIAAQRGCSRRQVSMVDTEHAYEWIHYPRSAEPNVEKKTTEVGGKKTAPGP